MDIECILSMPYLLELLRSQLSPEAISNINKYRIIDLESCNVQAGDVLW
jgi:hypothetical protein